MSINFEDKQLKLFGNREFRVKPISIEALSKDLEATLDEFVQIPSDFDIPEDFFLLRICNPNVSNKELIEISKHITSGPGLTLLAFNTRLPFDCAFNMVRNAEDKLWDFDIQSEGLDASVIQQIKSDLETVDEDDFLVWYSRKLAMEILGQKNMELTDWCKQRAPRIFDWLMALNEANLFRFFWSNSPFGGEINWQCVLQESNGAVLLTEFVRMKRKGNLTDESTFDVREWDEDTEEEFEGFISELVYEGDWENEYADNDLAKCLYLPQVYYDEGIPHASFVDIEGGSIVLTTSADERVFLEWETSKPTESDLVGIRGSAGGDGSFPILPLHNIVGELEMILVCLEYEGESLDDVMALYLDPFSEIEGKFRTSFPYYVGDVKCKGDVLISDAVWTEFEKTDESVLFMGLPVEEYGVVAFLDIGLHGFLGHPSNSSLTGIALVRGSMRRKYKLFDSLYGDSKQARNSNLFARLLRDI